MAIDWTTYKANSWNREIEKTETTHEGLVLTPSWSQEERVMSDIWADVSYCKVWNIEKQAAVAIVLGYHFELGLRFGTPTVDAPPEIMAQYEAAVAAEKAERERLEVERAERAEQERELAAWNRPEHGKRMQVVRGRKVKKGTVGLVFWLDDCRNPSRVGLALSPEKDSRGRFTNVAWVDAQYLANLAPQESAR